MAKTMVKLEKHKVMQKEGTHYEASDKIYLEPPPLEPTVQEDLASLSPTTTSALKTSSGLKISATMAIDPDPDCSQPQT